MSWLILIIWLSLIPVGFFQCDCCGGDTVTCLLFSDTFTRSDDTDIGSDWTENSGDWSIASNKLSITATGSAQATVVLTHDASAITVSATVSAPSAGQVRLYIGSNYGEVTFNGASSSIAVNGETTSPGKNTGVSLTNGSSYLMTVCINSFGTFTATIVDNSAIGKSAFKAVSPASAGVSFGVGTGTLSSGSATFDNVSASRVEAECEYCSEPCGSCIGGVGPSVYKCTISGFNSSGGHCSSACAGLNGVYYVPFYPAGSTPGSICSWSLLDCLGGPLCGSSPSHLWNLGISAFVDVLLPSYTTVNSLKVQLGQQSNDPDIGEPPFFTWRFSTANLATKLDCLTVDGPITLTNFEDEAGPSRNCDGNSPTPTCVLEAMP